MRLQALCLDTIVKSIEKFNEIYLSTDDKNIKLGFHTLQKVYSEELIRLLTDKYHFVQAKYADLVFNMHMKSFDTGWVSGYSRDTIIQIFTRIGPNLKKIIINEFNGLHMQWTDIICHIPNVEHLIYRYFCRDYDIRLITEHCPNLEILDIMYSVSVSTHAIRLFCQHKQKGLKRSSKGKCLAQRGNVPCPQLKEIMLEHTSVEDQGVALLLKSLPLIEKIGYDRLPVLLLEKHIRDLDKLDKVEKYNLRHLDMFCTDNNLLKICATLCPKLEFLYCRITKMESLNLCPAFQNVKNLVLYCVNKPVIYVSDFVKENVPKLTSLVLRKCTISKSALEYCLLRLNHLHMDRVTIQQDDSKTSSIFYNLKSLHIEEADFSNSVNFNAICYILRSSPSITKLCFSMCGLFPPELKVEILKCCEQCAVEYIQFEFSVIEGDFMKQLLKTCSSLKTINLAGFYLSEKLADELYEISRSLPKKPQILRY